MIARASTLLLLALCGCTTVRLALDFGKQLEEARTLALIEGTISTEAPHEGPLVVVVGRATESSSLVGVDSFVRSRPGRFRFNVAPGRYQLGAYEDRNHNGKLDPGENTRPVHTSPVHEVGPGDVAREDIVLARDAGSPPEVTEPVDVLGLVARTPREQAGFSLWTWSVHGEICTDLMDPRFGREAGRRGLWQVMDFLTAGDAGIYFLAPYDRARIPVIFVHGIGGSPQDFATLIESVDTERFQPWFYFYPSGFTLDSLSTHFATLLDRLQVEHGFEKLAIVAHSMGGLVSRGAILKYAAESGRGDDVRLFVTISTPWGGQPQAESAAGAPIELPPVFVDMDPSSDYLRWLFHQGDDRRRLAADTEFHMLFGFRMAKSSSSANDGVVTVASEARLEAQAEAASIRALDAGHVDILENATTIERVNHLLSMRFRRLGVPWSS